MDNDDDENGNEETAGGEGDVSVEPFETVQEDDEEDALLTPDPLSPLPGNAPTDPWRDVVVDS